MSVEITPEFLERLNTAYFAWFTTVRDDGMPQPTPVWFVWDSGTILIYTIDQSRKHKNFLANPRVALSYCDDGEGERFWVITGTAAVDPAAPPPHQHPIYYAKYATGIPDIGMTPESFAAQFSVPIRVTPTHIRVE